MVSVEKRSSVLRKNIQSRDNPPTKSLVKQKQNELAIEVINKLPSWDNLWMVFNSFTKKHNLENRMNLPVFNMSFLWSKIQYKWEVMVRITNHMVSSVYDKPWYSSYGIVSCLRNGKLTHRGSGILLDNQGREYEMDSVEFLAMTKIILCNFLEIPLSDEQMKVQREFHYSDSKFYKVLD